MGFYIHTCSKMRYKAAYQPSDLLCPETKVSAMKQQPQHCFVLVIVFQFNSPCDPRSGSASHQRF